MHQGLPRFRPFLYRALYKDEFQILVILGAPPDL